MEQTKTPVSVLGLGDMGAALARALLDEGHPTTVWNRSPGKAATLVARGAVEALTPAEAVAASPLVITCLLDHTSVHDVLDPVSDELTGRVLVNLTTGTPGEGRELAAWAAERGAAGFLDGGIMAVPSMIGGTEAFILYSGSQEAFEAHRSTLAAFGAESFTGADAGTAALYDLAMLNAMYGMLGGFLQAVAIVESNGVKPRDFVSPWLIPWLQAMMGLLPDMADQIETGEYAATESNLAMQTSGVGLVEFSESIGVSGALMEPVERLMKQRVAQGYGGDEFSSVVELIKASRKR